MERDYAIAVLEREARRILDIVGEDGRLSEEISSCPGWTIEDLVKHLGNVYNWAGTIVAERLTSPPSRDALPQRPADMGYSEWMADRLARLVRTLSDTPPDTAVWTFAPSEPSTVAFWWRRQAHETLIHRVDAELAGEMAITPIEPSLAADNVDELFDIQSFERADDAGGTERTSDAGDAGGPEDASDAGAGAESPATTPNAQAQEQPSDGSPRSVRLVHLHATDLEGAEWTIDTGSRSISHRHAKADVALKGPAWALARWCWGRPALDEIEAFGDLDAGEAWRDSIAR